MNAKKDSAMMVSWMIRLRWLVRACLVRDVLVYFKPRTYLLVERDSSSLNLLKSS